VLWIGRTTRHSRHAPAIVTARNPHRRQYADVPDDLTPEELQRRSDGADALWRELVRHVSRD
jgi:hypothetical protein